MDLGIGGCFFNRNQPQVEGIGITRMWNRENEADEAIGNDIYLPRCEDQKVEYLDNSK